MNAKIKSEAKRHLQEQIERLEDSLTIARADLDALRDVTSEESQWQASVFSAWSSEGEPNWSGTVKAPDLEGAVYEAMLAFCKKAGRAYPGRPGKYQYDRFDVQGSVLISLHLANGSLIPANSIRVDRIKGKFNRKAPSSESPKPRSARASRNLLDWSL